MIILKALYFFVPAYFANMSPVFAAKIFGQLGSKPIWEKGLGSHKTWRGLVAAIVVGIIMAYIQLFLYNATNFFRSLSLFDYNQMNLVALGFLFGLGAMVGDAVKSFFKRRQKLKPGAPWFPFDQIDFVLGGLVFVLPIFRPSWVIWLILLIVSPVLHILTNRIGYYLGIKKVKW